MFDLVIIGGSAASTAAGIYAARRRLKLKMVCKEFGGEVATSGEILNYPGMTETEGFALTAKFKEHLKYNEVEPEEGVTVTGIVKKGEGNFEVFGRKIDTPVSYQAKAVIVATGVHPRHLGVPGEDVFYGKGVTYCTTCDGPLYKNKKVVTIGGGNSALESALMLAEIASHVTLLNKNDKFKGEQVLIDKVSHSPKIEVLYQAQTKSIAGEQFVKKVIYEDKKSQTEKSVATDGVFVHIGLIPNSDFIPAAVKKTPLGEIEINMKAQTSVPGFFAAGDVTNVPYKQIAIATGQGVTATLSAV